MIINLFYKRDFHNDHEAMDAPSIPNKQFHFFRVVQAYSSIGRGLKTYISIQIGVFC